MALAVRVLGPLEVLVDGRPAGLGGPKQRALFALLTAAANQPRRVDTLADHLWGDRPPGQPSRSIQVYVSALRKALGPYGGALAGIHGAYRLDVDADQVDALEFERLADRGTEAVSAATPIEAADLLDAALALWRGHAYDGFAEEPLRAEADRLEERRLAAQESWAEASLALGRHRELLPELDALAALHPYRERLQASLVLALYRVGRTADALETYEETRRRLDDDLGLEPGPELQALQTAILRQEPSLSVEPAELRARRHLPAPATGLIGRAAEIEAVVDLLTTPGIRLVTLIGPGGIGKTRIALRAAHELASEFADGVWFVGLAPLTSSDLVASTIARALGVDEGPGGAVPALADHLRDRRLLLVCDNFEHVDDAAPVVSELLAAAPDVRVLVTSREALHLYGEHVRGVPTLDLDDEAVALFHTRASAVAGAHHGYPAADPGQRPTVATICERLDCLPLAIELVAARADELPPADLLAALERRLEVATSGPRDLPARQRTLRAAIDWSYQLLAVPDRDVFVRLGVLSDGFDEAAARVVVGATPDHLTSLLRKSLLVGRLDGPQRRFAMLETIREFALDQLDATDGQDMVRATHAAYYLELAERAEEGMRGPDQLAWTAEVEGAHDNFRAALGRLVDRRHTDRSAAEDGLRLATALSGFWYRTGRAAEGGRWLERLLVDSHDLPALLRGRALHGLGILQSMRNEGALARSTFRASGEIFRLLGDDRNLARSLNSQGAVARDDGDAAEARRLFEESLELWRRVGDRSRTGLVLGNLGLVARDAMDLPRARALLEEGLAIDEELNNTWGSAGKLVSLAIIALDEGDLDQATELLTRCTSRYRELGARHGLTEALDVAAWIAAARGDHRVAARLGGAAAAERDELGIVLGPHDVNLVEQHLRSARVALGDEFDAIWAGGRGETFEQALADAGLGDPSR